MLKQARVLFARLIMSNRLTRAAFRRIALDEKVFLDILSTSKARVRVQTAPEVRRAVKALSESAQTEATLPPARPDFAPFRRALAAGDTETADTFGAGFSHKRHAVYFMPGTAYLIDQWLRNMPQEAEIFVIIPPASQEIGRQMLARYEGRNLASVFLQEGDLPGQLAPLMQELPEMNSVLFPITGAFKELEFQPENWVPDLTPHYELIRQLWRCGFRQFALRSFAGNAYLSIPHLLDEYVGRHAGRRCFIVGNGPSLNEIDMTRLKDEITFGANRCYMGYEQWGFAFTYWGIVDRLQIEEYGLEYIDELPPETPKFFPFEYATLFDAENGCPMPFDYSSQQPYRFSGAPDKIYLGFTVVHAMMQVAAIMGCNPIILIGCDHRYNLKLDDKKPDVVGKRNAQVWSAQDASKPTHFTEKYTAEGEKPKKFITPKPERSEAAFEAARKWCEAQGIQVYNATPNSGLEVFEKVDYNDLFSNDQ